MSRFLVVEDNEMNMVLVRDLLEHKGHQVVCAVSVEEALCRLREAMPDIVLTDLRLPGPGGDALLRTIRADPALRHLPVVVLTAEAMDDDRKRLLAMGFNGYISKPISVRAFRESIETWTQ